MDGTHVAGEPRILFLDEATSHIDSETEQVVQRALAKDPADRPTAHELLDMLLTADTSELAGRPEFRGKRIVTVACSFAERYISSALFEGL